MPPAPQTSAARVRSGSDLSQAPQNCRTQNSDYAGFVRAQHLHAVFDCIDVFCCASGNDTNKDKTLGFWLGTHARLETAWSGAAYGGEDPTYRPTEHSEPRARLRWLRPAAAYGKILGVICGPAASTAKQWDSVVAAMIAQLYY